MYRCLLRGLLMLFAVSCGLVSHASQPGLLLRLGDSAYMHKLYDSAIIYYGEATIADRSNAIAWYKLGNAQYRMRHIGEAVLSYKRALKHNPGFTPAAENIEVIQSSLQDVSVKNEDVFFIRWWKALTKPAWSNTWAVLSILLFGLPLGLLAWSRFSRKRGIWIMPQVIIGCMAAGVIFAVLAAIAANSSAYANTAVVMQHDAVLQMKYSGKGPGKPGMTSLPEGLLLRVVSKEKDAVYVVLPDGREGSMQPSDIALVE